MKHIYVTTGSLNAGMGHTHVSKFLSGLNIPTCTWNSYKTHEVEVGLAAEKLARQSCLHAVAEERQLTIDNSDAVTKML